MLVSICKNLSFVIWSCMSMLLTVILPGLKIPIKLWLQSHLPHESFALGISLETSVKSLLYGKEVVHSSLKLCEMLALRKTQQNRTAHISRTLSIPSGKSPREMRISSGTAKARWGFKKGTCAGVAETGHGWRVWGWQSRSPLWLRQYWLARFMSGNPLFLNILQQRQGLAGS